MVFYTQMLPYLPSGTKNGNDNIYIYIRCHVFLFFFFVGGGEVWSQSVEGLLSKSRKYRGEKNPTGVTVSLDQSRQQHRYNRIFFGLYDIFIKNNLRNFWHFWHFLLLLNTFLALLALFGHFGKIYIFCCIFGLLWHCFRVFLCWVLQHFLYVSICFCLFLSVWEFILFLCYFPHTSRYLVSPVCRV